MFRNRRKTIGLFITDHFDESFQSELCRGVVERAKENDINVAIFSMYTSYNDPIFDRGACRFGPCIPPPAKVA